MDPRLKATQPLPATHSLVNTPMEASLCPTPTSHGAARAGGHTAGLQAPSPGTACRAQLSGAGGSLPPSLQWVP